MGCGSMGESEQVAGRDLQSGDVVHDGDTWTLVANLPDVDPDQLYWRWVGW